MCPVSNKLFTDNMKIVVISSTGNVFSGQVVDELNKKPKVWRDLLNDKVFKPSEIIVLQDPLNNSNRLVDQFYYIKNKLIFDLKKQRDIETEKATIEHSALGKRIMDLNTIEKTKKIAIEKENKELKKSNIQFDPEVMISVTDFLKERNELKDWVHEIFNTGRVSTSVTSTYMDLETHDVRRPLNDFEMYERVWYDIKVNHKKCYVQIETSIGKLNAELYSDRACRTVYSFLQLCYEEKMKNLKFRKLFEGVMIRIDCKKAKSQKLQTVDKSEKLVHDRPGLLTIATTGELNSFGITLGDAGSLDDDNTIFGEVVGNTKVLHDVWDFRVSADNLPEKVVEILDVKVLVDPYREVCHGLRKGLFGFDKIEKKLKVDKEKEYHSDTLKEVFMI